MTLTLFIILAPLISMTLIVALRRFVVPLALSGALVSFGTALATLVRVADGARFSTSFGGLPTYPWRLVVDPISAILALTVATVSLFVLVYAVGYMRDESGRARFFAEMALFAGAMQILVLAGDWILFLMAWEMIGLASYLLIGFWFERDGVRQAATRAFLVTRCADLGLYTGVIILITQAGTSRISDTLNLSGSLALAASFTLLLAAMGKSAQVPLQGWLQDAMVGPTPVSALLHSATLVVAGVVLFIRVTPLLPPDARLIVGLVGGITAIVAGLIAVAARDFKRMLAASTSSQLGFMLLAIGSGFPGAALFHLVTQATFKSSLFLGAGIFQHARHSTRFSDLRGVGWAYGWVFAAVVVAGLSLAGVPPLAGFWSKDTVIAASLQSPNSWLFVPLVTIGTVLTGLYTARALRLLWRPPQSHPAGREPVSGIVWMVTGLGILAALAVAVGFGEGWLDRFLPSEIPSETAAIVIGVIAAFSGLAAGWFQPASFWLRGARPTVERGFRIQGGFSQLVGEPVLAFAQLTDRLDRRIHALALTIGRSGLVVADAARRMDDTWIHSLVVAVGRGGLAMANAARRMDDEGIDGVIRALVRRTREAGRLATQLQSGLVHRELLLAAGGAAVVVLVVLLR